MVLFIYLLIVVTLFTSVVIPTYLSIHALPIPPTCSTGCFVWLRVWSCLSTLLGHNACQLEQHLVYCTSYHLRNEIVLWMIEI